MQQKQLLAKGHLTFSQAPVVRKKNIFHFLGFHSVSGKFQPFTFHPWQSTFSAWWSREAFCKHLLKIINNYEHATYMYIDFGYLTSVCVASMVCNNEL